MPKKPSTKTPERAIPRAVFSRIVREISEERCKHFRVVKWSAAAMGGLHEETELFLDDHFRRAQQMAERFKHATVGVKHFGGRDPPPQECVRNITAP